VSFKINLITIKVFHLQLSHKALDLQSRLEVDEQDQGHEKGCCKNSKEIKKQLLTKSV